MTRRFPSQETPAAVTELRAGVAPRRRGLTGSIRMPDWLGALLSAHTGEAEHPDRPIVNAPIGDRDRSEATLAGRSAVELALLSP
jgi:hypothetical protein